MEIRSRKGIKGKKGRRPVSNRMKKRKKAVPRPAPAASQDPEVTGAEAAYLKTLIEEETPVAITLRNGEELRGYVRYYDRDIFSLGPLDGGPKLLLRKSSIRYLHEIAEEAG